MAPRYKVTLTTGERIELQPHRNPATGATAWVRLFEVHVSIVFGVGRWVHKSRMHGGGNPESYPVQSISMPCRPS